MDKIEETFKIFCNIFTQIIIVKLLTCTLIVFFIDMFI